MRAWRSPAGLAALLVILGLMGLLLGALAGSSGWQAARALWDDGVARQIVLEIRLPRSLGAWLAGGLLGLAGALAQGLFRNPLADPFLLGSASGATLAVCLWLSLAGGGALMVQPLLGPTGAAFVGALGAVLLTVALSRGVQHTLRLLLAGVIVGVVLGALSNWLSLLQPQVLQAMQGFMLGSTALVGWPACGVMAAALALGLLLAWPLARVLDALALGEDTARSLGMPLGWARWLLITAFALATGAAVAQVGLVAFVGLAAPHLVRSISPAGYGWHLPLSALAGALLLLLADLLARVLTAPQDMPVGVLTAVLGGAYLLVRMSHGSRGGGRS